MWNKKPAATGALITRRAVGAQKTQYKSFIFLDDSSVLYRPVHAGTYTSAIQGDSSAVYVDGSPGVVATLFQCGSQTGVRAFCEARSLPSGVMGPRDLAPLVWEARICFSVAMTARLWNGRDVSSGGAEPFVAGIEIIGGKFLGMATDEHR